MPSDVNLEEVILDRFFYLLTKRDDCPAQLLERLQGFREADRLRSSAEILAVLKEGITQDG